MNRALLALLLVLATHALASAGPCDSEAAAAKKAGRDPSLVGPTEASAVALMREGNTHHAEALKRQRLVATEDQAGIEFAAAIDSYVRAAMVSSAPSILYNLAVTYRASGDYEKAIRQYRLFLEKTKAGEPLRRLVECHIASMTAELEQAAAKAPPREPVSPDPPLGEPRPVAVRDEPGARESRPTPLAWRDLPAFVARPWYDDSLGWGLTGTGAAVVGVGTFLLLDARGMRTDAASEPREDVRIELREKAGERETWGTVVTATGAVVLISGIVKLAITPDVPRMGRTAVRFSPGLVALEGRF